MGMKVFNCLDFSRHMENKTIKLTAAVDFLCSKESFFFFLKPSTNLKYDHSKARIISKVFTNAKTVKKHYSIKYINTIKTNNQIRK